MYLCWDIHYHEKLRLFDLSIVAFSGGCGVCFSGIGRRSGADFSQFVGFQKPDWLSDLSLGAKETYDDNVLLVADKTPGLRAQSSVVSTVSPKVGFNFAPVLGAAKTMQTLSLVYSPDFTVFHNAPSESYNAHKIGDTIKGQTGDFSFLLDNAFLFNDGSSKTPTYALSQASAAYEADQFRSTYAHGVPRERRKQIQDRAAIVLQYDIDKFFVRPTASLLYYDMMTDWNSTIKGYQNYPDRADVNGGADLGYRITKDFAVTLGYRYGHQYQQAFTYVYDTHTVNGQQEQSSSDYQRILMGLEGKPWKWLNVKMAGGPDFRDYNSATPINDCHPTTYYGEAVLTATISPSQTLTFTYKQWQWVSSSGKIPFFDSTYALAYHWNATRQLGFDLGGKFLESDYNCGNYTTGTTAPSLRDDALYSVSAGASYAFTPHFSAGLTCAFDFGRNLQENLPASLYAGYREFDHQTISISAQYKF